MRLRHALHLRRAIAFEAPTSCRGASCNINMRTRTPHISRVSLVKATDSTVAAHARAIPSFLPIRLWQRTLGLLTHPAHPNRACKCNVRPMHGGAPRVHALCHFPAHASYTRACTTNITHVAKIIARAHAPCAHTAHAFLAFQA